MAIDRIAEARNNLALLAQRGVLADLGIGAVQVGHAGGDDDALGVAPRTSADPVTGIDSWLAVHGGVAQVSAPSLVARPSAGRQRLAEAVGSGQAAEVAALAGIDAGDEKTHGAVARRPHGTTPGDQRNRCHGGADGKNETAGHRKTPEHRWNLEDTVLPQGTSKRLRSTYSGIVVAWMSEKKRAI